jgi:5'-methylthioadenosine phosphorylase
MKLAIIGGSGLEDNRTFQYVRETIKDTIYGKVSVTHCLVSGHEILFLARHGRNHTKSPSEVNYRANITALKILGATHIIATTACGSLREDIYPGDLVIPNSFIDFTKNRVSTFHTSFEKEMVHPPMSDPFDGNLRGVLFNTMCDLGLNGDCVGAIVTIEGPRFSTRAESRMYQKWGADIIGMTTATECALANEAGIPYAAIAMVTDYDCWKEGTTVTADDVMDVFAQNKETVVQVLSSAVERLHGNCGPSPVEKAAWVMGVAMESRRKHFQGKDK